MTAAIDAVGFRPFVDGLFAVEKCQPDAESFELFAAQLVGDGQKKAGA